MVDAGGFLGDENFWQEVETMFVFMWFLISVLLSVTRKYRGPFFDRAEVWNLFVVSFC